MIIEIAGGEGMNHESRELLKRSKELDDAIVEVREDVEDVKEEVENITADGLDISKSYSGYSQEGKHTDTSHYERTTRTGVSYTNDVGASGMIMTESPLPYSAEYETQDFELTFATTNKLKGTAKEGMITTGDYKVVDSDGNVTASLVELNNDLGGFKKVYSERVSVTTKEITLKPNKAYILVSVSTYSIGTLYYIQTAGSQNTMAVVPLVSSTYFNVSPSSDSVLNVTTTADYKVDIYEISTFL